MKKAKIIAAALMVALLTLGSLVGCLRGDITGSGNLDTEEFDFSGFTRVEASHAFEVEIIQSGSYSVSITADDNLFQYIQVSKVGGTLKIGLKPALSYTSVTLRARITLPELYGIELSGASEGSISGFSSSHDFSAELSGASSLEIDDMVAGEIDFNISGASRVSGEIEAADARFEVSGASTVEMDGSAKDIVIDASGASHVELDDFPVDNADVSLSGASNATVNLDGTLDANLSGASHLRYIGQPTMGDIDISGGSTVSKK